MNALDISHIDKGEILAAIDPVALNFILDQLNNSGYKTCFSDGQKNELVRLFDKLFWNPAERIIFIKKDRPTIRIGDAVHIVVHDLFFQKFGYGIGSDLLLDLFSEAMASCAEIIFILMVGKYGDFNLDIIAKQVHLNLDDRDEFEAFSKLYETTCNNQVFGYISLVSSFLELYETLLQYKDFYMQQPQINRCAFESKVKKIQHYWLIRMFDFPGNILFSSLYWKKNNYSFNTIALGMQCFKETLAKHSNADGFSDFIVSIRDEVYENYISKMRK
ncbi:hypothetical protein [Chromobacterium violaceum]|uniref:hypothetical protein n=1 Tax=Chromobacterium violaceum TaxID=536 RepID=UPI0012D3373B|nr:hypothetical protein [Chromobacterium violaceum]